jgi:Glycine/D-amino acid oxidases (deaminating)
MDRTADIVIVGAGVNGASVAFHLAQAGAGRIAVLDASYPGAGASSRGMGLLRQYHANLPEARLAVRSVETFANWDAIVGGSCGYVRTGFMWLDHAENLNEVERNVGALRELGARADVIDTEALAGMQPGMTTDDTIAAYEPDGGTARGPEIVDGFLAGARRRGATLSTHTTVTGVDVRGERVVAVRTRDGVIAAGTVILAAGFHTGALTDALGIRLPIQPRRLTIGRIYLSDPPPTEVTFLDGQFDTSFRPESNGTALVSMRDRRYGAPVDLDFAYDDVDAWARPDGLERLGRRLPSVAAAPVAATWVGVDGFTPDYKGVYGAIDGIEGLYVVAGSSEKGLKVSPAVGAGMAELITTGTSELVGAPEFSPSRFAGDATPDGEWINVGQLL